jgi:hypothetical protein
MLNPVVLSRRSFNGQCNDFIIHKTRTFSTDEAVFSPSLVTEAASEM